MAIKRETKWRNCIKEKLIKAGKWKEFNQTVTDRRKEHGWTLQQAYVNLALELQLKPTWQEFLHVDRQRRKKLSESALRNAKLMREMQKSAVANTGESEDNVDDVLARLVAAEDDSIKKEQELKLQRELVQNAIPNVIVEDDGVFNPIRDAEWVYRNMNRLFKVDRALGIERLDEEVLKEAPSNAAVGLAAHALRDKSKFYEKYGLILLKSSDKDESDSASEDQLIDELDPSFRGLEKYLAEKVPTNAAETLSHDLGKTKA